ncbi:zinc-binding dehydrogenase [Amycolatopsis sp. CA-128772]|uniref:alcohol dehydrogenase catalytic domain-containing protein n=1 Tax=Amycolatopsis sp. CA-128772 TaxID=2073159 RepID=UPI00351A2CAF
MNEMTAAVLEEFGKLPALHTIPAPELGTGEVLVDVVAAPVLPYAAEVFRGERNSLLTLPVVPGTGAIGRVRATGPDATRLTAGDWVLCDPAIRSRDDALNPDITLQGLTARGDGGLLLQRRFGHGAFAEQLLVPTENAIPLGRLDPAEAGRWSALTVCLVPYGGLLAADLRAGETVLVSGATGHFGSAAVAVALAMGAACVVAPGRDEAALADLERRFGARVRPVRLTGDDDTGRLRRAAPGPIDVVLDLLPPSAGTAPVRTAAMAVREQGRIVLMGGVGEDLALPYRWLMRNGITLRGQWLCPRTAPASLIALARAGLLDLGGFTVTEFPLADLADAVGHAATAPRRFALTVVRP